MSLVRWGPFTTADDLFLRPLPQLLAQWPRLGLPANGDGGFEWSPTTDISETDKEYLIRAEIPAVRKDDVKVTIDQGMITIEGERRQEKTEKSERFHRTERFHGTFMRSFSLPDNANADSVRCESRDGVLTVHIPKIEKSAGKPVQVPVG